MRKKMVAGVILLILALALPDSGQAQTTATIWDGNAWQSLPQEIKVAYIKGVGNLADYETAISGSRTGLVSKALEDEWRGKTIVQIVQEVDSYYRQNPQKMTMPVIEVMLRCCGGLTIPEGRAPGKK